eukprot:PhM_4_TR14116/c2_g1_i3/m.42881
MMKEQTLQISFKIQSAFFSLIMEMSLFIGDVFFLLSFLDEVVLEHDTEACVAFADALHGGVHVAVRVLLDHGLDVVLGGELEHVAHLAAGAKRRRGHRQALEHDGLDGEAQGLAGGSDKVQRAVRPQQRRELRHVEGAARDGDEDVVQGAGGRGHGLGAGRVDQALGAELLREVRLASAARDGVHLRTHLGRELHGEVAEAADADDTDALALAVDALEVVVEGREHRQTSAHERAHVGLGVALGDLEEHARVRAEVAGEAAVVGVLAGLVLGVGEVRERAVRAQVVVVLVAQCARVARLGLRAETDDVADLEMLHVGAHGEHVADDLMAGHEGVAAHGPVVVDHVDVGVANAVVRDDDVGVVLRERLRLVRVRDGLGFGLEVAHGLDLGGDLLSGHF